MAKSPVSLPFTTDGVEIAVKDNTAVPANARGNLAAGLDPSNNTQFLNLNASGDLKVDGSGVTQPVSGTVTANIGTSGSLALDATLTGGTQKAIVRGGAKGATSAADVTSTTEGTDHQALDVQVYHGGAAINPTQIRALASGTDSIAAVQSGTWNITNVSGTVSLPTGAATSANQTTLGSQTTKINDGTNTVSVKAASTAALSTDPSLVTAFSPNSPLPTGTNEVGKVAQGTAAATAGAWPIKVTDGTNTVGVVAASSTAVASNPSLVVQVSPNQEAVPVKQENYLLDSFARLRTSEPVTLFDGKSLYGNRAIDFVESLTGSATAADVANSPIRRLTVTANAADSAIRQTRRYFPYQAGKSHQVLVTFTMGAAIVNVTRRVGYFDGSNGIFLEQTSAGASLVMRTSTSGAAVDTAVAQASWNVDPFDGTGPSGVSLDLTKAQILYTDLEWLGVGIVRMGFVVDGNVYYAHTFKHANVSTGVYMQTAALPVRWEIRNTAASAGATFDCNCASVASEGGNDYPGTLTSIDRGVTVQTFSSGVGTALRPLVSVRAQTAYTRMTAFPEQIGVVCVTNSANAFRWALLLNPTITGGTAASWTAITDSGLEFDIARTGTVSAGYQVASGYGFANTTVVLFQRLLSLGATVAGVRDEYVLAMQQLSGSTSEDYVGSIQMREVF